jgi:hypothetical protein
MLLRDGCELTLACCPPVRRRQTSYQSRSLNLVIVRPPIKLSPNCGPARVFAVAQNEQPAARGYPDFYQAYRRPPGGRGSRAQSRHGDRAAARRQARHCGPRRRIRAAIRFRPSSAPRTSCAAACATSRPAAGPGTPCRSAEPLGSRGSCATRGARLPRKSP